MINLLSITRKRLILLWKPTNNILIILLLLLFIFGCDSEKEKTIVCEWDDFSYNSITKDSSFFNVLPFTENLRLGSLYNKKNMEFYEAKNIGTFNECLTDYFFTTKNKVLKNSNLDSVIYYQEFMYKDSILFHYRIIFTGKNYLKGLSELKEIEQTERNLYENLFLNKTIESIKIKKIDKKNSYYLYFSKYNNSTMKVGFTISENHWTH